MKPTIHPEFHTKSKVTCACGNEFVTGSTMESIHIELCSNCHPFYTGKQKLVDTAGIVDKFRQRVAAKEGKEHLKGKKVKKAGLQAKKVAKKKADDK